ncbi:RT0821/Lpp0805 family surface protein [Methylocystis parvus]|uniref:RT0821/Lpp0805 family surface protein n=1 Tax=Methylocystis parvus TaxID=134 RepID=UPI003C767AA3
MQFSRNRHIEAGLSAQFPPVAILASFVAVCALSSCSIAIPVSSSNNSPMWQGAPEDVTGSIAKPPLKLSRHLDTEDVRRAIAALSTALDPQGSGASVNWDNPQSGAKGSFTPVGQAYPLDGKICRAFLADVSASESIERLQGAACREKTAEWTLTEVKPFRKG